MKMKRILKEKSKFIAILFMAFFFLSDTVLPHSVYGDGYISEMQLGDNHMTSRNVGRQWIYKKMNGRLYRRLYDYTNEKWLSDWILVG